MARVPPTPSAGPRTPHTQAGLLRRFASTTLLVLGALLAGALVGIVFAEFGPGLVGAIGLAVAGLLILLVTVSGARVSPRGRSTTDHAAIQTVGHSVLALGGVATIVAAGLGWDAAMHTDSPYLFYVWGAVFGLGLCATIVGLARWMNTRRSGKEFRPESE